MIQFVLRFSKFFLALLTAMLFSSCVKTYEFRGIDSVSGSGTVITQKREVTGNFDKIQVSSSLDVELEQAPTYEISVKADDNLLEYIVTEVEGNTLKIYFDNVSVANYKEAKIYVKTPEISELKASSSSEIEAKGTIISDELTLKTSSTADIKLDKVRAKNIDIEATSSSEIKVKEIYAVNIKAKTTSTADFEAYIEADVISAEASSSSDIELKGKALELNASTSSTATIDAKELLVNHVTAASSSSSTIKTHPILSLKAKASSASSVYYYNEPKTIEKETSSAGSVKKNR
ncbi:MAG: head GIN domain-containing protein [Flavobacteriaceae bacterium]